MSDNKSLIFIYMTIVMMCFTSFLLIIPLGPDNVKGEVTGISENAHGTQFTFINNIKILGPFNIIPIFLFSVWLYLGIGIAKDLVNPLVPS